MNTSRFDIATSDGLCDSFVAHPDRPGPYPAVLFFMDAYGPRSYLHQMAEKLASHGYYVLLPNLFYRTRRAPIIDVPFPIQKEKVQEARAQLMSIYKTYDPEDGLKDIDVFLHFLSEQSMVGKGKVGLTGYCMGGGMAIRAAGCYPDRIAVAASFHGGSLATDQPNSPHTYLPNVQAELYIAHADQDASMPEEQIERLRIALDEAQVRYRMETYEGAAHGYTMADLPAYDPGALERHWKSLLELLSRNHHVR